MARPIYPQEFKRDSASLVVDKNYSISEACEAVDVSDSAMRSWVKQLRAERDGTTPVDSKALTPEHQRIQQLEARIKRIEREKEILKKATALLMSDAIISY